MDQKKKSQETDSHIPSHLIYDKDDTAIQWKKKVYCVLSIKYWISIWKNIYLRLLLVILKVWSIDPWEFPRYFQGIFEVKTIFISILRHSLPSPLCWYLQCWYKKKWKVKPMIPLNLISQWQQTILVFKLY